MHNPGEDNPIRQLLDKYGLEVKTSDSDNEQVWSIESIEYTGDQIDQAWDTFLHVCFSLFRPERLTFLGSSPYEQVKYTV